MSLNAENNGTRRIITVQLPEDLDEKYANDSKTKKAKTKKVLDFFR